jgi:UDP-N-acetylglucosamine diphosphorylase/glucosamine-1-phosphate N-acetyltransferase
MKIVLFEDTAFKNFLPLVYFRPVWGLRCGAFTLAEKWKLITGTKLYGISREYLLPHYQDCIQPVTNERQNEKYLFLNSRLMPTEEIWQQLQQLRLNDSHGWYVDEELIAFYANFEELNKISNTDGTIAAEDVRNQMPVSEFKAKNTPNILRYLWDVIRINGRELTSDLLKWANLSTIEGKCYPGVFLMSEENIAISKHAVVQPGVVVNAENGPVWIDKGATVMANSVLVGPLYVGKNSVIKIGSKIYENTSIGPVCKIGGEVEGSIIQGFANKQHEGFLGHAYLGEWTNLGADTNNSDLKNNYGAVTVNLNGTPINTGERFVGLMMGDHSKCAINTMFNTGTIAGVCCNIFGAGMPPKFIPSFSWGGAEKLVPYKFEKAKAVAKIVMERRKQIYDENTEKLFSAVIELAKSVEKGSLLV